MIITPPIRLVPRRFRAGFFAPCLLFLGLAQAQAAGTRDEAPVVMEPLTVAAEKTHTLFMGADIAVSLDKDLYPVKDVVGASWVLAINGQDKLVTTKAAEINLKITPNLKLTEGAATIVGFNRMQTYSFQNDPNVIITKRLTKAGMSTAMLQGVASDAQAYLDTVGNRGLGPAAIFADSDKQFGDAALMNGAQTGYKSVNSGPAAGGAGASQAAAVKYATQQLEVANGNTKSEAESLGQPTTMGFDAMNVDFRISSAKPLLNPYVVTMARYHPKGAKPNVVQNHVYARALDPIDSHPQHVHFVEDGFPFDYELVEFQLHIYNRGVEVATNLSANRVDLTRDEAFEYVKIEYIGAHHGETLPAVPAMGKLPAELPNRLARGDYGQPFYVMVSREGLADEPFADRACKRKIDDPFLESVVKDLRFKPALSSGRPVAGIAEVNLGKLQI